MAGIEGLILQLPRGSSTSAKLSAPGAVLLTPCRCRFSRRIRCWRVPNTSKASSSVVAMLNGNGAGGQRQPDSLLEAAIRAAAIRASESQRPDPLFVDPYAACLLSPDVSHNNLNGEGISAPSLFPCNYSIATKFIDDKLLSYMNDLDELRQVVLLTDGMDTRPFRLNWPRSSIIYDISPEHVFKSACVRLQGVGAKLARTCMVVHVPWESSDIMETLYMKGFNGNKPSIWVLQGLALNTIARLKDILNLVGSLATKGCIFMGELPISLAEPAVMPSAQNWIEKIFMAHGFRADVVQCHKYGKTLHLDLPVQDSKNILFLAEQLRLSDAQMERWRAEFLRIEDEGDEEGFEEL